MVNLVETPSYPATSTATPAVLRNGLMSQKISGNELSDGTIFASKLVVGQQGYVHDLVFTSTDYNTVEWAEGTIQLASGSSYTISPGTTGEMPVRTYLYFDVASGQLVTTTDHALAVSDNKLLIAIAFPSSLETGKATFTVFQSDGTTIDGDKIATGKVQSQDGKTYFDLDGNVIMFNDGSYDRGLIGYQPNGF